MLQDPNRLGAALQTRLEKEDVEKRGYVITGFPETEEEAKALQNIGVFPEIVCNMIKYYYMVFSEVDGTGYCY